MRYPKARIGSPLLLNGRVVEFSLWPDSQGNKGTFYSLSVWPQLYTYVRTKKVLSQEVSNRCLSFLKQSEEFYKAGADTEILTAPLMYYYAYLNLAKAYITIRQEHILTGNEYHGLHFRDFPQRITRNVFEQLVARVHESNSERINWFSTLIDECGFSYANPTVSLLQCFNELPIIHDLMARVMRTKRQLFMFYPEFMLDSNTNEAYVHGSFHNSEFSQSERRTMTQWINTSTAFQRVTSDDEYLKQSFMFETVRTAPYNRRDISNFKITIIDPWKSSLKIQFESRFNDVIYYLSVVNNTLPQLAADFAAMFILSSLSRYKPEDYYKLISSKYGWVIHEYLSRQPNQYLHLAASGILRTEIA